MPAEPLLSAESLAKGFGEGEARVELFSGLSLELGAGEAAAIVGPSGCGKSTLLHLLAGLDSPDAGRVLVDGRDWTTLPPEPRAKWRGEAVGFVFQLHHLLPELTAEENVALPLLLAGSPEGPARSAARELLSRVGLSRQAGAFPRVLSGGERQRVAIARAVVRSPRLLLCDEPTGSLDAAHAADVLDLLLGAARERAGALLLVTHDPGVASRCGSVRTLTPAGLSAG
ncbi:MAG TPA: ABC transporter ATP-binding protein [Thermoanaerobaculia bacterium]|nr:ABC transporter ATP-binding protein [Thermoanaerobaculia bacterium]